MFAFALAALAALQIPTAITQEPGSVRLFGDWAVGCDNGWTCEALSLPTEDWSVGNGYSITVRQAGGSDGYNRIGIRIYEDDPGNAVTLRIDGEVVGTATRSDGDELYHFDPAISVRLGGQLARGTEAALYDAEGGVLDSISLDGSYAALLYIEDRQGRAGTFAASAAVGDEPLSAIPEPPVLPVVRAMPIAAREGESVEPLPAEEAVRLHLARDCDGIDDQVRRNDAFVLSDTMDLILIACSDGAYNFSDIAYVRPAGGGAAVPARFDQVFAWGEDRETPLLVNVAWTPESGELSTYAKGRGIGDCGTAERFVWDGMMFRLIERREMNSCRGSPHWIIVWRADVEWVEP